MATRTLALVPPVAVTPPQPPCPVCGYSEGFRDPGWSCDGCDAEMHPECYWGRVAPLTEWQDYLARWIAPPECPEDPPRCLCPACRKREGLTPQQEGGPR